MIRFIRYALLAGVCCLPLFTYGQANEVSLTVGGIKSYSQSGLVCEAIIVCQPPSSFFHIDTGFAIQGAVAHRLLGVGVASLDLELPFIGVPARGVSSLNNISPGDMSSLFFTPSLKVRIVPAAAISPFVSAGGGLAHYSVNSTTTNKAAFAFGGGVDFKTPLPLLRIRGEVRDVASGQPSFGPGTSTDSPRRHNLFFGAGFALRF